jgi:hypothetical protein
VQCQPRSTILALPLHLFRMSFALNGTHITGGTFNNVSGNMSQVFHSHVPHIRLSHPGLRQLEGDGDQALLVEHDRYTSPDSIRGSSGPIRTNRVSRHCNPRPYGEPKPFSSNITGIEMSPAIGVHGQGSNDPELTHTDVARTIFNSVRGNMTQISVTSYGDSGACCTFFCPPGI